MPTLSKPLKPSIHAKQKFKHAAERPWSLSGVIGSQGMHANEPAIRIMAGDTQTCLAVIPLGRNTREARLKAYADAQLLTTAVNYHDALTTSLKNLTDCYGVGSTPEQFCKNIHDFMMKARTLIKRIEDGEYAYPE